MLLVFGSINIDFVYQVDALPLPGETRLASGFQTMPGGKGANQAFAAATAGAEVSMVGSVGSDPLANIGLDALKAASVDISGVTVTDAPTGTASINVDAAGENSIVVAAGANGLTRAASVTDDMLRRATTILMQMEVPHKDIETLLGRGRALGKRTILNLAPFAPLEDSVLKEVDFLVVNETEFEDLADACDLPEMATTERIDAFAEALGCSVVLTLGSKGVLASHKGEQTFTPALQIDVTDTTGAGDAFTGVFAAALDAGQTFQDAIRAGSVAGGLACQKLGAQASAPDQSAIREALKRLAPTEVRQH